MDPLILALETGIGTGSIAVTRGRDVIAEIAAEVSRAEELLQKIETLLARYSIKLQDVGTLAVSVGPGSYTGIRIGIATVLGLKRVLNIDANGVPVLEALAWSSDKQVVAGVLPTGRGRFAVQVFKQSEFGLQAQSPPSAIDELNLIKEIQAKPKVEFVLSSVCGESVIAGVTRSEIANVTIDRSNLALLIARFSAVGDRDVNNLEPIYLS